MKISESFIRFIGITAILVSAGYFYLYVIVGFNY